MERIHRIAQTIVIVWGKEVSGQLDLFRCERIDSLCGVEVKEQFVVKGGEKFVT